MSRRTAKERALEAVGSLPDDATLDEAIERLCFIAKVEEGLRESESGDVISHEEVKKHLLS
jgi:predicted transcriptional regulator